MTHHSKENFWIQSPSVDLAFFSFGWVLAFAAYLIFAQTSMARTAQWVLINGTLLLTVFHRHLTFPLVYGDPQKFRARKKTYIFLPLIFLLLTVASLFYVKSPTTFFYPTQNPLVIENPTRMVIQERSSAGNQNFPIRFQPGIYQLSQVAQKIEWALEGKVLVRAEGDQLQWVPLPVTQGSRFYFRTPIRSQLREDLGFPRRVVPGWRAERPVFMFLLILSGLWNIYHTLMQKVGILRVYSRRSRYGKSWLDKGMVLIWFNYLFFQLAAMSKARNEVQRLASTGRFLNSLVEPLLPWLPLLAKVSLGVALVWTVIYLKEEWEHRKNFNLPKNLFLVSNLMIYATFFYNFLIGFVLFGLSHAVEYLAFVSIYSKRNYSQGVAAKTWMGRFTRHGWVYLATFMVFSAAVFVPWYFNSRATLTYYIVGSSFLHFLYDGWIWKVRKPEVGQPLGIQYQTAGA